MLIAIDTETQGFNTKRMLCGAIAFENGKTEVFNGFDEPIEARKMMWKRIMEIIEKEAKRDKNTWIYAHNMEYDWNVFARDYMFNDEIVYNSLSPFIVTVKSKANPSRRGYFLDNMALFKMSLNKLGEIVGFKKMVTPTKLKTDVEQSYRIEEREKIMRYCERDAKVVLQALDTLRESLRKVGFSPKKYITSGQLTVNLMTSFLKKNGLWNKIAEYGKIIETKNDEFIRVAFKGARCQSFVKGNFKGTSMIDSNSLYPFIMHKMRFPDLRSEKMFNFENAYDKSKVLFDDFRGILGLIQCKIKIEKELPLNLGYLCIRFRDKLIFPNKKGLVLEGVWTISEIEKAVELGYKVVEIKKILAYKENYNILRNYMEMLYKMRREAKERKDRGMELVIKNMMNHLFGKFAQKSNKKERRFIYWRELEGYMKEGWKWEGDIGDRRMISRKIDEERKYFVNPIISALISAEARDYLYEHIKIIEGKGGNKVLYCDTDSIMFTGKLNKKGINIGENWGEWKYVFKNEDAVIRGEKKYMHGDTVRVSGIGRIYLNKRGFRKGSIKHRRMRRIATAARDGGEAGTFEMVRADLKGETKAEMILPETVIDDKLKKKKETFK